jgi:hypothetical protein
MSTAGATGPGAPADRQKTRSELEQEAGQRRLARHGLSPKQLNRAASVFLCPAGETIETGIVAAATAKQPQADGIQRDMPPTPLAPEPINQGQAPQADHAASPNPHAPTSVTPREFLARVLPWPGDDQPGYINMHVMGTGSDGKTFWTGSPTRDVEQFQQVVCQALTWRTPPDIYMCMSRQARTKENTKDGKVRAAKSHDQALALKSIFLDIDVKPPPHGYATLPDALDALKLFCATMRLPQPTALVMSGGGLHAHWISDRALTPAEWQSYANGLKQAAMNFGLHCDAGVTGDSARVLRVPGTFNYKTSPPRPVKLLSMQDNDYAFARDLAMLPSIAPLAPMSAKPALPGRPAPAFACLDPKESLAEGIRDELAPVDCEPVAQQCAFIGNALKTGGSPAGSTRPLGARRLSEEPGGLLSPQVRTWRSLLVSNSGATSSASSSFRRLPGPASPLLLTMLLPPCHPHRMALPGI